MEKVRQKELYNKVKILASVTPLKSAALARYMSTYISGMDIPEEMIGRLRRLSTRSKHRGKGNIKILRWEQIWTILNL